MVSPFGRTGCWPTLRRNARSLELAIDPALACRDVSDRTAMHDRRPCSPQLDPAPRPLLGDRPTDRFRPRLLAALRRDPGGSDRPCLRPGRRAGLVPAAGM